LAGAMPSIDGRENGAADELASREEEIRGLKGTLASRDRMISRLRDDVRRLNETLTVREERIEALRSQAAETRPADELEARDQTIKALKDDINALNDELAAQSSKCSKLKSQITHREEEIRKKDAEIERLNGRMAGAAGRQRDPGCGCVVM